jgi:hypothetical protein
MRSTRPSVARPNDLAMSLAQAPVEKVVISPRLARGRPQSRQSVLKLLLRGIRDVLFATSHRDAICVARIRHLSFKADVPKALLKMGARFDILFIGSYKGSRL